MQKIVKKRVESTIRRQNGRHHRISDEKIIYIHYRIITKHLLRGCFMISSLSYDNIIMIPKRRFIKKIEIRIFP